MPGSCPGGTLCYQDSLDNIWRCCGKDPGEGCATGSRVLRHSNGTVRLCIPGVPSQQCPGASICQWSFVIDRYQCCETDNGCPRGQAPLLDILSTPRDCSPRKPCPDGAACRFNFWTASYQCCKQDVQELCEAAEVPLLDTNTGDPVTCRRDSACPLHFYCSESSRVCCGDAGTCPSQKEHPVRDDFGRLRACSVINPDVCPDNSRCRESIPPLGRSRNGQRICCSDALFSCPISGTPYPNAGHPQQCDLENLMSCPDGTECQPSNIPGTSICCRQVGNLCPRGWSSPSSVNIFCQPNVESTANCPGTSACIFSSHAHQFVCCVPEPDVLIGRQRTALRCAPPYNQVEMMAGEPRECLAESALPCSPGYMCRESVENPLIRICCRSTESRDEPLFRCPNAGQIAAVRDNQNIFCDTLGQRDQCPNGAICQSALNSFGMAICCYTSTTNTPMCPADSMPQPAVAGFVPCDLNMPGQCNDGFACTRAVNDPQTALCCSRANMPRLICPSQQTIYMEAGRPRYCSRAQLAPCPQGFSCEESVGTPNVFICCSTTSITTCPQGYAPSLSFSGSMIFCSPTDINVCPSDARCLQAQNRPQTYVCCRSTETPRVCPGNQNALLRPNGQPETCTGPGSGCSQQGYTCQLSQVLMNWVCCGQPQRTARCADGRETYTQEIGRTFTCNPLVFPGMCPNGYECSFSDQPGTNVCCRAAQPPNPGTDVTFRPPVDELTCPLGWSAYEDSNGAHHFCQSATDMSCPQGFSCAQSSVAGIFICCRLASNLKCQNTQVTLLVNNNPRLCTMNNFNSCPRGYTCQQSTVAQVNICCGQSSSTTGELLCRDGQIPAYVGPNVRYCSRLGQPDTCPPTYICSPSNRAGMNVCCHYFPPTRRTHIRLHSGQVTNVCGETAAPFLNRQGLPVECSEDPSACPADFDCQPSMTNTNMYCCQEAACPGPSSYDGGGVGRKCSTNDDCQTMLECMQSVNLPDVTVCCPVPSAIHQFTHHSTSRCIGRKTLLVAGNNVPCANDDGCTVGYECSSYTTNAESTCCQSSLELDNACPENRDPYRDSTTDEYAYCDVGNTECPNGFLCKHNIHSGRRICCSPIAFCPNGRVPLIDSLTQQAKRCFEKSSVSSVRSSQCSAGYTCQESSVALISVCCSAPQAFWNPAHPRHRDESRPQWTVVEG